MFAGSYVAIVTPFKNGRIDEQAFAHLIEMHAKAGTDGIVPCGTTGESATLTFEEHENLVALTVKLVNKRMKVIAGTGANNTAEAVQLSKAAQRDGADGCLIVTPYYNKPTQNGLFEYYKTISEAISIPIMIYNVPGRTGVNITPSTMARIADLPNVKAVKEASGDLIQLTEMALACPKNLALLSGDDMLLLSSLAIGASGVVSVIANILPTETKELISAFNARDTQRALTIHQKMFPLMKAMFMETNPIPVKAALYLLGLIGPEIRSPLTVMERDHLLLLKKHLQDFGLEVKVPI